MPAPDHVQATVRTWSETTRAGSVLLDDGSEVPYDARAFEASGLQRLRPGQRVRLEVEPGTRRVSLVTIATLPSPHHDSA